MAKLSNAATKGIRLITINNVTEYEDVTPSPESGAYEMFLSPNGVLMLDESPIVGLGWEGTPVYVGGRYIGPGTIHTSDGYTILGDGTLFTEYFSPGSGIAITFDDYGYVFTNWFVVDTITSDTEMTVTEEIYSGTIMNYGSYDTGSGYFGNTIDDALASTTDIEHVGIGPGANPWVVIAPEVKVYGCSLNMCGADLWIFGESFSDTMEISNIGNLNLIGCSFTSLSIRDADKVTIADSNSIYGIEMDNVKIANITNVNITGSAPGMIGFDLDLVTNVTIENCNIGAGCDKGIVARKFTNCLSQNNTGSADAYGLFTEDAGIIYKQGSQPTGNTLNQLGNIIPERAFGSSANVPANAGEGDQYFFTDIGSGGILGTYNSAYWIDGTGEIINLF